MKINITGGGIIGLFTAWYLQKDGHEIHIFDKTNMSDSCSHGNAGMITPSHFMPLASPGVVAQGIRWMFNASSPFYVKPRLDLELFSWLWRFYRSCNRRQAEAAMPVLLDFNLLGKKLYREFYKESGLDFKLKEEGILMLYQTPKKEKEELEAARVAAKLGCEALPLTASEVAEFETGTPVKARGGVFYPADAYLYPNQLIQLLQEHLRKNGVQFHPHRAVTGFETKAGKVTALRSGDASFDADAFVMAAGSWSGQLMKKLGIRLPVQDGKGYSFTLKKPAERPRHAIIFSEAKVAVTPMGDDLRFGGTLELGGLSPAINMKRVNGILASIPRYFPNLKVEPPQPQDIWHGYRPCSPDGLPYIGRVKKFDNLIVATGHAMMGLSLGPATGLMVSEILKGEAEERYVRFFDADRWG
jgi:D-amino-acid dehydrogenase